MNVVMYQLCNTVYKTDKIEKIAALLLCGLQIVGVFHLMKNTDDDNEPATHCRTRQGQTYHKIYLTAVGELLQLGPAILENHYDVI